MNEDPPLTEILQTTKTKSSNSAPVMEICMGMCTAFSSTHSCLAVVVGVALWRVWVLEVELDKDARIRSTSKTN